MGVGFYREPAMLKGPPIATHMGPLKPHLEGLLRDANEVTEGP